MRESLESERRKRERARRYEREDEARRRGAYYTERPERRRSSRGRRSSGRSRSSSMFPLVIAGVVIAAIALILLGNGLFREIGGSREKADLSEYFGVSSDSETVIIIDGKVCDEKAVIQNGIPFVPVSLAASYYDNFYYDSLEGHLLSTGANSTVEGAQGTDYIILEDTVYLSVPFVNRFVPLTYETYEDPSRIDIVTKPDNETFAKIKKETKLRVSSDKQSEILVDLDDGDEVQILQENEDWAEIRYKAVTGYAETECIDEERSEKTINPEGGAEADLSYQKNLRNHKIVLGFHNVAVADANSYLADAVSPTKGMNVIAPTWFSLAGSDGNLADIGSADYVAKAHEMGYEVWGVVDNFTQDTDTNEVLSRTSKRITLEQNLLDSALKLGLDGINIDFEQLPGETGDDFSQFLRELSIYTRANSLVLSVDNYVPQDYTDFYRRDIQGRVADYVVIMGYDEHTAASDEAGSVASLGFVTQGIEDTLKEVPAAQVINALPFYTRKWSFEGGTLSCESLGMRDAAAFISDNGVQTVWDADTCQNYASFEKDGVNYSIWLEDAESISSKLAVMTAHDLGGVGCWKLTQETPDIWDIIASYYPSGS